MCADSTVVAADTVRFRLDDPGPAVDGVKLWLDLEHHVEPPSMHRTSAGWELTIDRPPVHRLEYLYVIRHADGSEEMICDPGNPNRVPTPFGDHSVVEFPGYAPPAWLAMPTGPGHMTELAVRAPDLHRSMAISIWTPSGWDASARLPILLFHDGPEFERLAQITRFCAAMIAQRRLPAHRLALLGPGDRNRWYAASPAYASALHDVALPAIRHAAPTEGMVVLAGASLGALAALHAATTVPGTAGALFLQSGSFFRPDLDAQEKSFSGFADVTDFVGRLERPEGSERLERAETAQGASQPLRIGMTCGLGEENLANNRRMAQTLARLGHQVRFREIADAHTYTGWRDALDPHLLDLLAAVWGSPR